ncbi:hypothetical protein EON82_00595 [bacterium]|nr:MAG: hypothetical protein EON82_00595 [bacterium]
MPAALLAGLLFFGRTFDFYTEGPYDSSVPRPEKILGYGPGERHTFYHDQERVVDALIRSAPNRAKKIVYGTSVEGRPLRVVAVSSPANLARLDQIRKEHEDLAQGKGDPNKTVPIVWINECIHGDETASFETSMWTLYTLLASRGDVAKALDKAVVILNPVYNPDGHERYVVYYNSISGGSAAPDAFEGMVPSTATGRANHYRFDMNRDRVAFSQPETRQEFAEMLRWGPQVYIDQHGQVASYFFPPEPMSVNSNVDRARNAKWTERLGRATAKAFEAKGLGYFTKEDFDFYYPGYLDTSTTLTGAIGMTHETDGGRRVAREREDGSTLTLTQGVFKHFTSALAVVKETAKGGQDILADYARFKRRAVSGEAAGKFRRVVMTGDPRELSRMKEHLGYAGVESRFAQAFNQPDAHDYWSTATGPQNFPAGSLVVDMSQPQAAMAKALLEPGQDFEPEFIKAQVDRFKGTKDPDAPDSAEFYDITGWSLPYAYNLKAWWCETAPVVTTVQERSSSVIVGSQLGKSTIGYAIRYTDQADILAVADALLKGVRGGVTTKAMRLGTNDYPAGTFLFVAERNDDDYEKTLFEACGKRGARIEPLSSAYPESTRYSPGSGSVMALRKPSLAVVMGNGTNLAQSGALWYLMERVFMLPFTPLSSGALNGGNLGRFSCVVLPSGVSTASSGGFADWLRSGGVGVALDAEWAVRESFTKLEPRKGESLPGTLFRAEIDPASFLGYGYASKTIAVPFSGSPFFTAKDSAISFDKDEKKSLLLSGWEWPDDTEKALHGAAFLQDISVGRGRLVAFLQDPTERAMWPGLYKALLNSMIVGSAG